MAKAQETRFQCSCPEHRSVTFLSQKLFLETELFRNSHAPFHKEMKFQLQIGMENYEKIHLDLSFGRGELFISSLISSRSSLPWPMRGILWKPSSLDILVMVLVEELGGGI